MQIVCDNEKDLLYLRLNGRRQDVKNRRIADDIVLDIGQDKKLVGIEIMDVSQHVHLDGLLPLSYQKPSQTIAMVCEEPEKYGTRDQ